MNLSVLTHLKQLFKTHAVIYAIRVNISETM